MRAWMGMCVIGLAAGCGGSVENGSGGGHATTSKTTTTATGEGGAAGGAGGMGTGAGLPEGKCRKQADCKIGVESCLPPGAPTGCGVCLTPATTCMVDAECAAMGATSICEPALCACNGESTCVEGCTSSAVCGVGESCEADHRCRGSVCAQQLDCPTNFICPPTLNPRCERRTCKVDPECDVGYCVEGACYDSLGDCTPPVP